MTTMQNVIIAEEGSEWEDYMIDADGDYQYEGKDFEKKELTAKSRREAYKAIGERFEVFTKEVLWYSNSINADGELDNSKAVDTDDVLTWEVWVREVDFNGKVFEATSEEGFTAWLDVAADILEGHLALSINEVLSALPDWAKAEWAS
jgi:hypothetical protein